MNITDIKKQANELLPQLIEWRRYFHETPEISWREVETTKKIASIIKEMGVTNIKVGFGGGESGLTGEIVGGKPGKCVALRADIDALAVQEETGLQFASKNSGAMHACGHDGHITGLLGAIKILTDHKDELEGKVKVIFQPGEEHGIKSGAAAMIAEGAIDGVDAIGGLHLWSFERTGLVQWKNGAVMSSADLFSIKVSGVGGHGGMPQSAIDPTITAANIVTALQTIISRELHPKEIVVISIGKIVSGEAFNIIPNTAELKGNIRTINPEVRATIEGRMRRIIEGIASAYRCKAELDFTPLYPTVINDERMTDIVRQTAFDVVGTENTEESNLLMVSEDFSYYEQKVPGSFFFVGAGKPGAYPHHSPFFTIDENALPVASSMLAGFALNTLDALNKSK